jgi:hypothetical protein
MNSTLANILLVGLCAVGLVIIFMAILVLIAFVQFQRMIAPDATAMKQRFDQLKAANSRLSDEALIQMIIRRQALKCGLVGAITGLGGFFTLPIALPIDILVSMRIQAAMVQFIEMVYNHQTSPNSDEHKLQTYLVLSGSVEVSETTSNVIMKLILRILGESLSIFIPAIGAAVGFGVNYIIARTTGMVAIRWYSTPKTTVV